MGVKWLQGDLREKTEALIRELQLEKDYLEKKLAKVAGDISLLESRLNEERR